MVRGGYGMNYTVGEYPRLRAPWPTSRRSPTSRPTYANNTCPPPAADCYSLANGFPAPNLIGNYAGGPALPAALRAGVQRRLQKTWPWGIVMNLGYNGSHGSNLDIKVAPSKTVSSPGTNPNRSPVLLRGVRRVLPIQCGHRAHE